MKLLIKTAVTVASLAAILAIPLTSFASFCENLITHPYSQYKTVAIHDLNGNLVPATVVFSNVAFKGHGTFRLFGSVVVNHVAFPFLPGSFCKERFVGAHDYFGSVPNWFIKIRSGGGWMKSSGFIDRTVGFAEPQAAFSRLHGRINTGYFYY